MNSISTRTSIDTTTLYYLSWQLNKRGWDVALAALDIPGAGSDMFLIDRKQGTVAGIRSKAMRQHAGVRAVSLGKLDEAPFTPWWIITIYADTEHPVSYIMTGNEVKELATRDANGNYSLSASAYVQELFSEAWGRLYCPAAV